MKILVNELVLTPIVQVIRPLKKTNIRSIRLHLYKHNNPNGSLSLTIHNGVEGSLIAESNQVIISSISQSPYFHGMVRFDLKCQLEKGTEYEIRLNSNGYSFNENGYVGWCQDFDFKTYDTEYEKLGGLRAPQDFEIWEIK